MLRYGTAKSTDPMFRVFSSLIYIQEACGWCKISAHSDLSSDSQHPQNHATPRDSVSVESSGSELKSECVDILHQSFLSVTPY